jgi:hypothetical protein
MDCFRKQGAKQGRASLGRLLVLLTFTGTAFSQGQIRFKDITDSSGVHFVHTDGSSGRRYIVETVTSGFGLIDFDNDGWQDILFLNGGILPGTAQTNPPPANALYRNNRNGTFTEVTAGSGLEKSEYGLGCVVGDYDNDGLEDVFITNYGKHRLYRNGGNGLFKEVTDQAGVADASGPFYVGAGSLFLDYDRDGWLDLFVGNYLQFDPAAHKPILRANVPSYVAPGNYPAVLNRLYRNNRNGTFTNVSDASGIGKLRGYAMGVVSADFDGDGWPDIYVGNDVMENFLFHNKRDGTFEEIGIVSGSALDQYGDPQGTMGVNVGDYDRDGRFDILVTDYQDQVNTLYRNLGNMQFQDVTVPTGIGVNSRSLVKWGCGLVDFDNDGTLEAFTAAGHLQDTVELYDKSSTYKQRSLLLQQQKGRFVDITAQSGAPAKMIESSRGAVFGDLNNDGRIDIVVLNARARAAVWLNETPATNHWITLKLEGTKSNRSGVGARVRVVAGGLAQVDEVRAGRGYQSAEDLRVHFGLGTNALVERLEVFWPSGASNTWTQVSTDRFLKLKEGQQLRQ